MKRFIDLRGQHTGFRFAWYCTVRDCFDTFDGDQAWSTWQEFAESATTAERGDDDLKRYRRLAPKWAFDPDPDDDFEADTVKEGEKMTIQRNGIYLAVCRASGAMFIAWGYSSLAYLRIVIGNDYDLKIIMYPSQVNHRCAALTPHGWRVMLLSEAQRDGYNWTRFRGCFSNTCGIPLYVGTAQDTGNDSL